MTLMPIQVASFCPSLPIIVKSFFGKSSEDKLLQALASHFNIFSDERFFLSPLFPKGRSAAFFLYHYLKEQYKATQLHLPAYTAQSLVYAGEAAGLEIVLHEVDPDTLFFTKEALEEIAGVRQKNIVVLPYLWGHVEMREQALAILGSTESIIIEDFATCYCEKRLELPPNHFGFLFSLGKTKLFSIGEGGLLFTKKKIEPPLAYRFSFWHGLNLILYLIYSTPLFFALLCFFRLLPRETYPLDKTIAQYYLSGYWLRLLENFLRDGAFQKKLEARETLLEKYQHLFEDSASSFPDHAGSRFPVLLESKETRDEIHRILNRSHIQSSRGYIDPIFNVASLKNLGFPSNEAAQDVSERLLTLPLHEYALKKFGQIARALKDR